MTTCLTLDLWTWPPANTFSCWLSWVAGKRPLSFCCFGVQTDKWFLFVLWRNGRADRYCPRMMSRICRHSLWMTKRSPPPLPKNSTFWGQKIESWKSLLISAFLNSGLGHNRGKKGKALCGKIQQKASLSTTIRSAIAFKYRVPQLRPAAQFPLLKLAAIFPPFFLLSKPLQRWEGKPPSQMLSLCCPFGQRSMVGKTSV